MFVLSSWPGCFLFQIQGCVPFPSCAAPISLRLPSCLPVLWDHCVAAVFVWQSSDKRAALKVLEGARENWDHSLLRLDVTFGLCPQTLLTSLRSDTDKQRHSVTFPHNDVTLVKMLSLGSFFLDRWIFFCLSELLWYDLFTPSYQTLSSFTDTLSIRRTS